MSKAQLCPVCRGTGKVMEPIKGNFVVPNDDPPEVTCHGCGGTGWVTVGGELLE